jgi:hypothetical protein
MLLVVESFLAPAPLAYAGLSRPPESHLCPMPDGSHMLVFLSPISPELDAGKWAKLPDGREVNLRKTFPASGYYEIGSAAPIWTAPWTGRDGWTVSNDGRFLVRWNIFGDGAYSYGGELSWGLKLYDRGKEIKSYDVAQLVDYPSLMPYTTSDWHRQWIGDGGDNPTIRNNEFLFETSTHETYRFDLTTGEVVGQFRMWRTLTRVATVLIAIIIAAAITVVVHRRRHATTREPNSIQLPTTSHKTAGQRSRLCFSYNLRTLLATTTGVAVMCLMIPRWPHVALLSSAVLAAAVLTRVSLSYQRADRSALSRRRRMVEGGIRWTAAGLAFLSCYVLSAGPVLSLLDWLQAPHDVRMAVALTIYRPIFWITLISPDVLSPLDWYFNAWGIR